MTQKDQKTFMKKPADVEHRWFVIDATGLTLGRLSSEIAKILRGKHDPSFTPHVDCGGGVIVLNAPKVTVSGDKEAQKVYRSYSGYQGGLKETSYLDMKKKPGGVIMPAVKKMMPRTKLGRRQLKRLRIFDGSEHGMEAQQPIPVNM